MGQQEFHEVKHGKNNPLSVEEWPQAPAHAGEQLCREGHGSPAGHQADHEPPRCPHGKDNQQAPGHIGQRVASRWREEVLPLCPALVGHFGVVGLGLEHQLGEVTVQRCPPVSAVQ